MFVLLRIGLLILSLSLDARAAEKWARLRTAHFELFTTQSEAAGRRTLRHFERIRELFRDLFGVEPSAATPVQVILFANERQYRPYRPSETAAGYHLTRQGRDYIVMAASGDQAERIATHEYMHLLVNWLGMKLPLAINEGIAELYSTIQPRGGKALLGEPIPAHVRQLQQEDPSWRGLAQLLEAHEGSPEYQDPARIRTFYAASWALMHLLSLNETYRPKSDEFLREVSKGVPAKTALEAVYARSLSQIGQDLRSHIRADHWLASRLLPAPWPKSTAEPVLTEPSMATIQALLGQLEHGLELDPGPPAPLAFTGLIGVGMIGGGLPALLAAGERPEDLGQSEGPLVPNPARPAVAATEPALELPVVSGVLTRFECLSKQARITVRRDERPIRLWIEDPAAVAIQSAGGATVDFACGAQSRRVRVAYHPQPDAARETSGIVASIEFVP